jgi:hypothetical protein
MTRFDARPWKFTLGFGPHLEFYAPAMVRLDRPVTKTARIGWQEVQFYPRNSMEYYAAWTRGWKGALRFLDEPSNTYFGEVRYRDQVALGIDVFHPKMFATESLGLSMIEITRGFLGIQPYVDAIVPLSRGRAGTLSLRAGGGIGLFTGYATATQRDASDRIVRTEHALSIIGANATLRGGIEYRLPGDHLSLTAHAATTAGFLDYSMLGGQVFQSHLAVKGGLSLSATF